MNKICKMFMAVFGLLILFSAFPTPAHAADIEDVNYTISYRNTIYCSATSVEFYDNHPYQFSSCKEEVDYEITDFSAVPAVAEFKKKAINYLNTTSWESDYIVCVVYVTNGTTYDVQADQKEEFLEFFGLPEEFSGTKEIVKEGIRFKVTLGNGKFFFSVITDLKGIERKNFPIKPKVDITVAEQIEYEVYNVSYWKKDTGFMGHTQEKSLQAALEHCAQNADLTKEIRISAQKTYRMRIQGKSLGGTIIEINYGNISVGAPQASSTQQSSSQQGHSSQQSTISSSQTSNQSASSAISETSQPDTKNESNFASKSEIVVNTDTSNIAQKENPKTEIIWIAAVLAAALIGGGVFLLIKFCYKEKKG